MEYRNAQNNWAVFLNEVVSVGTKWAKSDFSNVAIMTLLNGVWLGAIAWLVLGYWLEVLNFYYCWIGATLVSWAVAIKRVGNAIEWRDEVAAEVEVEFERREEIEPALVMLDTIEKTNGGEGLRHIKHNIFAELIADIEETKAALEDGGVGRRVVCLSAIYAVLERELTSGKYHTYRGVLSRDGEELLTLWDHIVKLRSIGNDFEGEDAERELQRMRSEIAKVGLVV